VDDYDSFANESMQTIDTCESDFEMEHCHKLSTSKQRLLQSLGEKLKRHTNTNAIGRMFFAAITPMTFADAFLGLNLVRDISGSPRFSTILGFNEKDFERALRMTGQANSDEKVKFHLEELRRRFNGYHFHAEQQNAIYNPQDCLCYLQSLVSTLDSRI
jgi:hypothetical protein